MLATPKESPSNPKIDRVTITISNISCTNLPRPRPRLPKFYAVVIVSGKSQNTKSADRGTSPSWKNLFRFDAPSVWSLNIQFWMDSTLWDDQLIAELESPILPSDVTTSSAVLLRDLVDCRKPTRFKLDGASVQLTVLATAIDSTPKLAIGLDVGHVSENFAVRGSPLKGTQKNRDAVAATNSMVEQGEGAVNMDASKFNRELAVEEAEEAVSSQDTPSEAALMALDAVADIGSIADQIQGVVNLWTPLLKQIAKFVELTDAMSNIHPYAQLAWSVLSVIPKAFLAQMDRDLRMKGLFESMNYAYDFVAAADCLQKIKSRPAVIERLAQQTTECAYFIRDYAAQQSFVVRTVKNMWSDADSAAAEFEKCFRELREAILGFTALNTESLVWRVVKDVQELVENDHLNQMQYAGGAKDTPKQACLPGTRTAILDEITDWVNLPNTEDVPRVFWLHGVAGSGKSAIALTIRDRFDSVSRLGSAFFFDKTFTDRTPAKLFSTVSRDIADLVPEWRISLSEVLQHSQALRTTSAVKEQWNRFVLEPARKLAESASTARRIIVIIDAVDEAEKSSARELMVSVFEDLGSLPSMFRIFVTSRPDDDMRAAFDGKDFVIAKDMAQLDENSVLEDIQSYIRYHLSPVDDATIQSLVQKATGHFQWIATTCRFVTGKQPIKEYGYSGGMSRQKRLDLVLQSADTYGLDGLYTTILTECFHDAAQDPAFLRRFHAVLGRVLHVQKPLTVVALAELRGDDEETTDVTEILSPLGSLLQGVSGEVDIPVRPLHASFRDYLMANSRSGQFHVPSSAQYEQRLAMACLHVMKSLCFNICHLETSHLRNDKVPDLQDRIKLYIPAALSYACCFWSYHIAKGPISADLLAALITILEEKFLYWLEVLSLLKEVNSASMHLLQLQSWCASSECNVQRDTIVHMNNTLTELLRFIRMCAGAIHLSAPHIYISALPFAPRSSQPFQAYQQAFQHTLNPYDPSLIHWPQCLTSMHGHVGPVSAVAFSADGKYIASGSFDRTLRLWSTETGQPIGIPFSAHSDRVNTLAFSPNGKIIVSGSWDKTLQIWDVKTGQPTGSPMEGHSNHIRSVAFSPDGKYIASASDDHSLRIWDAETRLPRGNPLRGHNHHVRSVAYSPDGKYIVSGSAECKIRVWEAETGKLVGVPLKGHTDVVRCAIFLPGGNHIVSGSSDNTLRIWDIKTSKPMGEPLRGHTDSVLSVALSPDQKHIVSASADHTLRVWDIATGQPVGSPMNGHSDWVRSVAFSQDGKYLVSGSDDQTIRIWDATIEPPVGSLLNRHSHSVLSVAFSPNGKHIVSGAADHTLVIWDSDTGLSISSPLLGHIKPVCSVTFSPDGAFIVSGSSDCTLQIWDARTGQPVGKPMKRRKHRVYSVAFSPNGKYIISGSSDYTLQMWNTETGDPVNSPMKGHDGWVRTAAFAPDGKYIVSGSDDQTLKLWDAKTGLAVGSPMKRHSHQINSVAFSPNGKHVVSGSSDHTLQIWDAETREPVGNPLAGHSNWVRTVAFSPDGRHIMSGSDDRTIRIWDASTHHELRSTLTGHIGGVKTLAFSPDGKRIVSGSADKNVIIWDVTPCTAAAPKSNTDLHPTKYQSATNIFESIYAAPQAMDGWMCGEAGELLFWIPAEFRTGFWHPQMLQVIGNKQPLHMDFTHFVHGAAWTQCHSPVQVV